MDTSDKKMQEKLAEKLAMDFIKNLPPDHYTSIKELGQLQRATKLQNDLVKVQIREEDFIMFFDCIKVRTNRPIFADCFYLLER